MDITAGLKLQIALETQKKEKTLQMTSQIATVGRNKVYLISAPLYEEMVFLVPNGYDVLVQFFDRAAIVSFDAKVLGTTKKDEHYYQLIRQTGEMRRVQRREDFRLDAVLPGELEYTPPGENKIKTMKIHTTDISGGGASIRATHSFQLGENVTVCLPLDKTEKLVPVSCVVRRCFRLENVTDEACYNVGLQFIFEDNRRKERLIQYIFKLERDKLKNGT